MRLRHSMLQMMFSLHNRNIVFFPCPSDTILTTNMLARLFSKESYTVMESVKKLSNDIKFALRKRLINAHDGLYLTLA